MTQTRRPFAWLAILTTCILLTGSGGASKGGTDLGGPGSAADSGAAGKADAEVVLKNDKGFVWWDLMSATGSTAQRQLAIKAGPRLACDPADACVTRIIRTTEEGVRLRVALQYEHDERLFRTLGFYGPDCTFRDDSCPEYISGSVDWTQELFLADPAIGRYQLVVAVLDSEPAPFNLRAKVELEPKATKDPFPLLPNPRSDPPFELTFQAPEGEVTAALGGSSSCTPAEHVDYGARRCLRYSFGVENAGDGPVWLDYGEGIRSEITGIQQGKAYQQILYSDGAFRTRPAGEYEFHLRHLHYHYGAYVQILLFRVLDPASGSIQATPVAESGKLGVCFADVRMVDFGRFFQDEDGKYSGVDEDTNCLGGGGLLTDPVAAVQARNRQSTGWVDFYRSHIYGNFIDIGDAPDGLFVARMTTNVGGLVLETNSKDNVGYTYFGLRDGVLTTMERGRGLDPWDRHKIVLDTEPTDHTKQ